ncbi:MAG: hypothetical protein QM831_43615 [Kofleriaceae bacterium]
MRLVGLAFFTACASQHVPIHDIAARPSDVQTIEGIVDAYYDIVNVKPGAARQWDRDHTLYAPWIHFVAHMPDRVIMTHQQFVDLFDATMAQGFEEHEIKRTITRYGNIAQVASTYETIAGGKHSRGVNLLQLYFDGARWWIEGAIWQDETPQLAIPPALLP